MSRFGVATIKRVGWVLAAWVVLLVDTGIARACTCAAFQGPREAFEFADVIFAGRTVGEPEYFADSDGFSIVRFRFEVSRVFKGQVGPVVSITTNYGGTACGRSYDLEPYLIYARYDVSEDRLVDSTCSRSRLVADAPNDLALLGPGWEPDATLVEEGPEAASVSFVSCGVAAGGGSGSFAAGALLIFTMFGFLRRKGRLQRGPGSKALR